MIWDLGPLILQAAERANAWSTAASDRVLRSIVAAVDDGVYDWDDGAGEGWGRVLAADSVVALVNMTIPLVFVRRGWLTAVDGLGVVVIDVDSMEDRGFRCDPAILLMLAPGPEISPALDPEDFSPDDLWFATV